ncbi:MAG TPA: hypothetical protein VNJ12_03550, partial [Candidatus Dormibacteraeota bacterium]|nr:hypothetical protein [Candidatus Dormibacteraeota bacterium]
PRGIAGDWLDCLSPRPGASTIQVLRGTEMHMVLLTGISTNVNRDGDPFEAMLTAPVFLGNQLLLPAGTHVQGIISRVYPPKRFNLFRGQAAMVLEFKSIELNNVQIPCQMSILSIEKSNQDPSRRKDLTTEEGSIVQERPDIKGDLKTAALATGGESVVGMIFSHLVRGLALGAAGGAAYVLIRKGKDVRLPAETLFRVRLDTTVTFPASLIQTSQQQAMASVQ